MKINLEKYHGFSTLSEDTIKNRIKTAPSKCPLTGMNKVTEYAYDEGVVYRCKDEDKYVYTLPEYNRLENSFFRWKIYNGDDCYKTYEFLCCLIELDEREDYEEIKEMYGII